MTSSPTTQCVIEDEPVELETIAEIIVKKIYHRGSSIRPRDIFDIAAAGESLADAIIEALRFYRPEVAKALAAVNKLNPDFVNGAIAELAIKDQFKSTAKTAIERTTKILSAV
jgi:hypothetical protein